MVDAADFDRVRRVFGGIRAGIEAAVGRARPMREVLGPALARVSA